MGSRSDLFWVVGGRAVAAVAALAAIRVSTALLPPLEYGILSMLMAFQMFCGLFMINPVGQHINRHTHSWWDDGTLVPRLHRYHRWILVTAATGAAITASWHLAAAPAAATQIGLAAAAVFAMVVAANWNATLVPLLNMVGFRATSVAWSIATAIAGLLISWCLAWQWPSATAWFAGQAAGMAIGALGAAVAVRRRASHQDRPQTSPALLDRATLFGYCLPLAAATGFMWLQVSGYRGIIEYYWGLQMLGFAAVGLTLASQIWGLCESLAMQFLYPFFYRRIAHADPAEGSAALSDLINTLGPVYLVLAALMTATGGLLLKLLADERYAAAAFFVSLGALIECGRVIANLFGNAAQVRRDTRTLVFPWAAGALLSITFLAVAGYRGSDLAWGSVALLGGSLVLSVAMAWRMGRELPIRLDWARWRWSAVVLAGGIGLAAASPGPRDGQLQLAVELLLAAGVGTALVFGMLWKNPALARLLAVRLQADEGKA